MADTEDLSYLSTSEGNAGVNGVKVGEPLTDKADGNAELRLAFNELQSIQIKSVFYEAKVHRLRTV
jgi:hypothetical protein